MSGPGLPPEIAAAMGGGDAMPMEAPSAGAEAVGQSQVAQAGLDAWKRCQASPGQRCSGDDLKAMVMYVLTEGPDAPEAADIAKYLQSKGVKLPGVGNQNSGDEGDY